MKKTLAIILALVLALSCASVIVETVEMPFEGSYIAFEDYGFAICMPNDWNVIEVSEEAAAAGIFYIFASPDGARTVQLTYSDLDGTVIENSDMLVAALSASYENVNPVQLNNINFAAFTLPEQDMNALYSTCGQGTGLIGFYFTPASDADFGPIAEAIAGSITPYQPE